MAASLQFTSRGREIKHAQKIKEILAAGGRTPNLSSPLAPEMAPPGYAAGQRGRGRPPKQTVMANLPAAPLSATTDCDEDNDDDDDDGLPDFCARTTMIYDWPCPRPKNFAPLSEYHANFKIKEDTRQKAEDIDDGSDDWDAFAGPFVPGDDNKTICSAAGSVLINRAKRAFWSGHTWEHFEESELASTSDEQELPNQIRLAIFDKLKTRLCEEIWSRKYVVAPDSAVESPAKSAVTVSRGRAAGARPPLKRPRLYPPTAAQAELSITAIQRGADGIEQPMYRSESSVPSMAPMLRAWRDDTAKLKGHIARGEVSGPQVMENFRTAAVHGVTLVGARLAMAPWEVSLQKNVEDMETSDEEGGGDDG